ncbi:mercuric reductase/transcriptional regulator%2C fusion [Mycobacterium tuberculosis]|nr:mercuric reductase/transcriptional regulator%2C fusion [Mycobacterium tuberculosis]
MSIDPDDVTAPWLQLAVILRKRIEDGTYEPGKRMPSLMALVEEFGLNAKTAKKAVDALRDEGLVVTSPGRGTFVKPSENGVEGPAGA